jgi:Tfp pilus assembly protein PilV
MIGLGVTGNASPLLTYVVFPLLVLSIAGATAMAFRFNRSARVRAIALAVDAERVSALLAATDARVAARLDTQDAALAQLLTVISPPGAPSLVAVMTRIEADMAAERLRLSDHIAQAAADKLAFDRRLELIGGKR